MSVYAVQNAFELMSKLKYLIAPMRNACVIVIAASAAAVSRGTSPGLTWNRHSAEITVAAGSDDTSFTFVATNNSAAAITVHEVLASCGCISVIPKEHPWLIHAGERRSLIVKMDLRGRNGRIRKSLFLRTNSGGYVLEVIANKPQSREQLTRARNQEIALRDRQAILREECANCHALPGAGKKSRELFEAVCAMCHVTEHGNAVGPPLMPNVLQVRDEKTLRAIIATGRANTLMPGFAAINGGPLDDEQIDSLVAFLLETDAPEHSAAR